MVIKNMNSNKNLAYRHGEIAFVKIDKLPDNLKKSKSKTFMVGLNNNAHTFDKGNLYLTNKDTFVFGYFEAKDTQLFHKEHGTKKVGQLKSCSLPDGIYELRRQVEFINDEMKVVVD